MDFISHQSIQDLVVTQEDMPILDDCVGQVRIKKHYIIKYMNPSTINSQSSASLILTSIFTSYIFTLYTHNHKLYESQMNLIIINWYALSALEYCEDNILLDIFFLFFFKIPKTQTIIAINNRMRPGVRFADYIYYQNSEAFGGHGRSHPSCLPASPASRCFLSGSLWPSPLWRGSSLAALSSAGSSLGWCHSETGSQRTRPLPSASERTLQDKTSRTCVRTNRTRTEFLIHRKCNLLSCLSSS